MNRDQLTILFCLLSLSVFGEDNIESTVMQDSLWSVSLNEYRMVSVYLPQDYETKKSYPVIYSTDGQIFLIEEKGQYKNVLDSLISNRIIPPIVFIGAHSNGKKYNEFLNYRSFEYIKGIDQLPQDSIIENRFENHQKFFINELSAWSIKYYSCSPKWKEHLFYGCSNGAGFGITLALNNPNLFSTYLCFSPVGYALPEESRSKSKSTHYISYGNKETEGFISSSKRIIKYYSEYGYKYFANEYDGDHSNKHWIKEFSKDLALVYEKR